MAGCSSVLAYQLLSLSAHLPLPATNLYYTHLYYTCVLHLDALCYEGCEGHGSANGLPQPRMELAERSHEHTYLGWYCWWSQAVLTF